MLTIVGLGCSPADLSEGGKNAVLSAGTVILRTGETPAAAGVKGLVPVETLDYIYRKSRNFDSLNKNLAAQVLREAKEKDVVYCVDGSVTEDVSAQILIAKRKDVRIFDGPSKSARAFAAAKISSCRSACVSAYDMGGYRRADLPLCVYDMDCELVAGDVKLRLADLFGDEADAYFISEKGAKKIKLYEADRQKGYGPLTALVLDEIPLLKKERFDYEDLIDIMRRLRAPDGCPWDRAQTHESICPNMIEEAYELVDAVGSGEDGKIIEETGDVLMQAAFHSVLGQERGAFSPEDVLSGVCGKLISRHTHIFGKDKATDEAGALSVWERNKMQEKSQKTGGDSVKDVPKVFPAAMRAQKVGKRAAKFGYDFKDIAQAAEKVPEELSELLAAVRSGNAAEIFEEAGDLLFSAINVGRLAGADCEASLKASTDKFVARFCLTEQLILQDGKKMQDLSSDELWAYYDKAKKIYDDQKH
ncbi:MAG TPA: nucleoside triphosphate pyrophosphohydrolase [Candidatus Borkfalkia excrementavium]|uniref:Nucleoside triphosphate pyrophosphohydrolase n=1 Tax=Candidatus Borkfalkia excrementavium TaxID=2838505 RepID=A0A9D1Z6P5_9FIRM|nr:nucleoside triphosphate pyrophosphohydrolase [Candidatus Borkfalkia excrementavium]